MSVVCDLEERYDTMIEVLTKRVGNLMTRQEVESINDELKHLGIDQTLQVSLLDLPGENLEDGQMLVGGLIVGFQMIRAEFEGCNGETKLFSIFYWDENGDMRYITENEKSKV